MPASLNPAAYQDALRVAFAAAQSACDRNRARLLKYPNVVDVRPGYKFQDGWITSIPAVVVTVLRKDDANALGDKALPSDLDGVPIDVAPATPLQQLQYMTAKKKGATRGPAVSTTPPGVPDLEPFLEPGDPMPTVSDDTGVRGADGGRGYKEPPNLKLAPVSGGVVAFMSCQPRRRVGEPLEVSWRRQEDADCRHV